MSVLFLLLALLLLPASCPAESITDAVPSCRVFLDGQEVSSVYAIPVIFSCRPFSTACASFSASPSTET